MFLRRKCFSVLGCGCFAGSGAEKNNNIQTKLFTEEWTHETVTDRTRTDGMWTDGTWADDGRDVGGRGVNERNVGGGT